jgi:hypothetical protein
MLASRERRKTSIARTSTLHWFETEVLAEERNYQGLARLNTDLMQHAAARPLAQRLILDIDSSESPVHGAQEESAYEVRLLLGVIAYNLGNLLRRLVLPVSIQSWSLTSLQHRLFKDRRAPHPACSVLRAPADRGLAEGYWSRAT